MLLAARPPSYLWNGLIILISAGYALPIALLDAFGKRFYSRVTGIGCLSGTQPMPQALKSARWFS